MWWTGDTNTQVGLDKWQRWVAAVMASNGCVIYWFVGQTVRCREVAAFEVVIWLSCDGRLAVAVCRAAVQQVSV